MPADTLARLHGTVSRGGAFHLLDDYLRWLSARAPHIELSPDWRGSEATAIVVAACLLPDPGRRDDAGPALGGLAAARVRSLIDADPTQVFDIADLARAGGVSRSTLFRQFKPIGGVAEYIWTARLEWARRQLSDPSQRLSLTRVAADAGFSSASHFSTRFR